MWCAVAAVASSSLVRIRQPSRAPSPILLRRVQLQLPVAVAKACARMQQTTLAATAERIGRSDTVDLFQRRTILLQSSLHPALEFLAMAAVGAAAEAGAAAEDQPVCAEAAAEVTEKVYMDIAIDGKEVGRMVIGVYGGEKKVGAQRFVEIAEGRKGVSYRRKEFVKVMGEYVENAGLRSFSLSGENKDRAGFTGGEGTEELVAELEEQKQRSSKCGGAVMNVAGAISIVVLKGGGSVEKKRKLVARDGKLEMVDEAPPPGPNGTQFAICVRDAPQLDSTNLVVGRVLDGFEVLQAMANVKVVQQNNSSPYFQAAKLVGDTRAVVAERGFNRPYSKILITKCGRTTTS